MEEISISLYLYGKKIFLAPVVCIDNGPLRISEPIVQLDKVLVEKELMNELIRCRDNWVKIQEEYSPGYKTLLKISGARSQKNLVSKGQLLRIKYDDSEMSLKLMKSNINNKSFYSETAEPNVIIENYLNRSFDVITEVKCLLSIDD